MAFATTTNRLRKLSGGFGIASNYDTGNVTAGATGTNTVTVPLSSLSGAPSFGLIRVRNYALGAAVVLGTVQITATDGTTTIELAQIPAPATTTAGQGCEYLVSFITELGLTSITVTAKNSLGTLTMSTDVEVISGP